MNSSLRYAFTVGMLAVAASSMASNLPAGLSISLTQPVGVAIATENIPVYVTFSLEADAEPLSFTFEGKSIATNFGLPDSLSLPKNNYDGREFERYSHAYLEFLYYTHGAVYAFEFKQNSARFDPVVFNLNPGGSFSYLSGVVSPNSYYGYDKLYGDVEMGLLFIWRVAGYDKDENLMLGSVGAVDLGEFKRHIVSSIPEPSTYTLMLAGMGAIVGAARVRRKIY